ncbi:hypothetical protein F5Y17DRAFT_468646 [Xylariaceae sp. FL0594]|nr:hypothetical protein F5Y17DRAFT_468646 [Xylariaceae sp. FL0594]
MSGRSAYVRKKITDPKTTSDKGIPSGRGRTSKSSGSGSRVDGDEASAYDVPMMLASAGTGYGTTNARFLKFSDPSSYPHGGDAVAGQYYRAAAAAADLSNLNLDGGSQSGGSENGRRETMSQTHGPMPDYAYARARKPVLKTEDVSGIERSGFRSAVDKTSDDIRKGLTKAFTLGLKKKKETSLPDRAPSAATIRPSYYDPDEYDAHEVPAMPIHRPSAGSWEHDHLQATSPPPSAKLPPLPPSSAPPIKRWVGAGRPVQRWNKLRKDPELWDPNGDVLVYFGRKDQPQRPNPSFRLSSHIIEATESRFLVTLLREGSTEDDFTNVNLPPSPVGAPPMARHNSYAQLDRTGQATPPVSDENVAADIDGQISYEMYFATPSNLTKVEAHRHAITTRNVFALLYHASLVGLSLFQALADLLNRLDTYMEPDSDNVGMILNYLSARGIDDARNDPETAVSMLAWSETPEVRWEEGWREAFLHCAGMYSRLESCADFKHLTPITRALLERACLETQLRVQAAEERLAAFAFADIWPATGPASNSTAKAAADRLQQFFISYYARTFGAWPPTERGARTSEGEDMWLTRSVAQLLQKDFGSLYDYLVNRDIVWDESETRSSRKWMMVSESGSKSFNADSEDLPLTDMLIEFDNRMRFPHIPHPYPLVPDSISPVSGTSGNSRDKSKKDKNAKPTPEDRTLDRRKQLAYTEATNIYILGSEFMQSDLIESFTKFEKADQIGAVDPFCARRGRWVLIYGILQILASVSVDSPNVRYKDGVSYHLSPRLKGTRTPPWKGATTEAHEACHELSYCWITPRSWHNALDNSAESDTSVTSNGTDPVIRMMRRNRANQNQNQNQNQKQQQRQQRSPFPAPLAVGRSSNTTTGTGRQTPSAYSMRSSSTAAPTMWGGSSAMSVSNYSEDMATSSVSSRNAPLGQYRAGGHKGLQRSGARGRGAVSDGTRSERSTGTVTIGLNGGGPGSQVGAHAVEEDIHPGVRLPEDMIREAAEAAAAAGIEEGRWPARTHSIYRSQPPAPLDLSIGVTGTGDFFDETYTPTSGFKPGRSPLGSDAMGPLIRDFDELNSVEEERAYENMI